MKKKIVFANVIIFLLIIFSLPALSIANAKKGLLVYDSIYGSTVEVAYWIRAIIGIENQLDVKTLPQVITIKPYDYIIIGSCTRNEKPLKAIYKFVEKNRRELAKKQVCYFLTCGDTDETMILKTPGGKPHLIAGRNYLFDIQEKFPEIKPVAIAGFGGRQVFSTMGTKDSLQIWLVGKLAKEGAPWKGLDIWESLVPERVEAFANEVITKILGLPPRGDIEKFRCYWHSLQPASLSDPTKVKFKPKPYEEHRSTDRVFFTRFRIRGNVDSAIALLQQWAKQTGVKLQEQKRSFYNIYYHGIKTYDEKERTIHIVAATLPEDPGYVHISFRSFDKPKERKGIERDIAQAETMLKAGTEK